MKKNGNIDNWMEEIFEKAIAQNKLHALLFSEEGKKTTAGYPREKLQTMMKRALKNVNTFSVKSIDGILT